MHSYESKSAKKSWNHTPSNAPNPFQTRSFGIQAQSKSEQSLSPQAELGKPYSTNLLNIPIHAPGTKSPPPPQIGLIQAKMAQMLDKSTPISVSSATNSDKIVQRQIMLDIDTDQHVVTDWNEARPSGLGGKQGDHTTPFTVLQNQLVNAIEGVQIAEAWDNLKDTLQVYKSLPGWDLSTKWVKETLCQNVEGLLDAKGDINDMQTAVTEMLRLRNQIALTSMPKGGHGKGEAKWAGSLQYQERQFQLGNDPTLDQKEVLTYMWKAFDHDRLNAIKSPDKQKQIIEQHAITMADAYPQLNASVGITADIIKGSFPKKTTRRYKPY